MFGALESGVIAKLLLLAWYVAADIGRAPKKDAALKLAVGADPLPSLIGPRVAEVDVDIGGERVDVEANDGDV